MAFSPGAEEAAEERKKSVKAAEERCRGFFEAGRNDPHKLFCGLCTLETSTFVRAAETVFNSSFILQQPLIPSHQPGSSIPIFLLVTRLTYGQAED